MKTLKALSSLIALFLYFGINLSAQTHVVTTSDDYVTGSLRHWVTNSNANDTIVFDPSILANGSDTIKVDFPIIFNHGLTIKGLFAGGDTLYISGQDSSRIFYMDFEGAANADVYLEDLAFIEGNQYASSGTDYKSQGGAILVYEARVFEIRNSIFRGNQVKGFGRGGAIFLWQTPNLRVYDCLFEHNHTQDSVQNPALGGSGGALYANQHLSEGTSIFENCVFRDNYSYSRGGAIVKSGGKLEVFNSSFLRNQVLNDYQTLALEGGAIAFRSDSGAIIEKSNFIDNYAQEYGGAVSLVKSDTLAVQKFQIENCYFEGNESRSKYNGSGAAIYAQGHTTNISYSTFVNNVHDEQGGAVSHSLGICNIYQSTFVGNEALKGSAILQYKSITSIIRSTLVGGSTNFSGTLVDTRYLPSESTTLVYNSILVNQGIFPTFTSPSTWTNSGYNIFSDNPSFSKGTDQVNISETALMLEPLGNYGGITPTCIPLPASPAINAGNPLDLSPAQNSPIFGIRDIGAAERQVLLADSFLVCGPITWWGNTYSHAGTYTDSAYNALGTLDSTGVLVLTEINDSATIKNPYIVALEQSVGTTYQWIDCNNPLVTLTGATDSIYQPTTNGSYAVIISLDGCVDTSNCAVYNQVSLDENVLPEQWMTFYPNPTNGSITVKGLDKNSLPTNLIIMDLSGRPLHEMTINSERIQLPPLAEGMYLLKFRGDDGLVQVERVVVRQ